MLLIFFGVFSVFAGLSAAVSALLGGGICVVGSAYFFVKMLAYRGPMQSKKMLGNFYRAEIMKVAIILALFAAVFKFFTVLLVPFIFSFAIMYFSSIVAGLWATPSCDEVRP